MFLSLKIYEEKITQIDAKTTQYEFNFLYIFFIINKILSNASIIYIHTIINGLKACLLFNKNSINHTGCTWCST